MEEKQKVLIMNQEAINKLAELLNSTPLGNQTLGSASQISSHFGQVFELLGKHIQDEKEESL